MDKPQFDAHLGGAVSLPRSVGIHQFIGARANEIAAISHSLKNPEQKKLVFQKLPVHMRRRVMSHNAKRLPRKLRQGHLEQMNKSGAPPIKKRPSRRYRRRPRNLLQEYNRRKRAKIWLETHIWHAKRFHMTEKWGYRLAHFSNDRGYRACYRAVKDHCMIQDISYYRCVELSGPSTILIDKLKNHSKNELSFGAKIYLDGSREGSLTFYKHNGGPLGTLTFMWRPNTTELKTLWLWLHPATASDILDELKATFSLVPSTFEASVSSKSYRNDSGCEMHLLDECLNRFRLLGPLTIAVITSALRLPASCEPKQPQENLDDDLMDQDVETNWYDTWFNNSDNLQSFTAQRYMFEAVQTLNSPSQLPRNGVLALTVLDPRFFLPPKRTKACLNSMKSSILHKMVPLASQSPLWNASAREDAKKSHKPTHKINKLRSNNLVPGVENDVGFSEHIMTKVPIILIQRPGSNETNKSDGFASGIDVILPAGWALSFWLSFVHRCARPGGLRECNTALFESLSLNSPEINHPDTPQYDREALTRLEALKEKYFRYPPNRRVNFVKYSISSPFLCEWKILVNEWTDADVLSVIRDRRILSALSSAVSNVQKDSDTRKYKQPLPAPGNFTSIFDSVGKSSLVLVKVTIMGRGRPKNFAVICLPTVEDMEKFNGNDKWRGPVQALCDDPGEAERKTLRIQHKQLLKQTMRQRKRARKQSKPLFPAESIHAVAKATYAAKMKDLYLPKCTAVRRSCGREVMGYVVQGDFSLSVSQGVGWGYVVLQPLLDLIARGSNEILVRNIQTRQYRRARIDIVNLYA